MEITARGDTPSTSGRSGSDEGILNKAILSAHAAVNSIAAKPAIDQVSAMVHQALDKAAAAVAPTADWLTEQGESVHATQNKLVADSCSYVSASPLRHYRLPWLRVFCLAVLFFDKLASWLLTLACRQCTSH